MKINRRDVVNVIFGSNTKQNHSVIVFRLKRLIQKKNNF